MVQTSVKKISVDEWNRFFKKYTYEFLQVPDYRLGQAFCNEFGELAEIIDQTYLLFYQTTNKEAWKIIKQYIDGEVDDPFSK